jgi:hypothetical protein
LESDKASFEWRFDDELRAVLRLCPLVGTQLNKESRKLFMDDYNEMFAGLQPSIIYFYGNVSCGCAGKEIALFTYSVSRWTVLFVDRYCTSYKYTFTILIFSILFNELEGNTFRRLTQLTETDVSPIFFFLYHLEHS